MSDTIASTFAAVAREAEAAIEPARVADPELDRKLEAFVDAAEGAGLRVVVDLKPRVAFRVEVVRVIGEQIDGLVIRQLTPPSRDAPLSTRAH